MTILIAAQSGRALAAAARRAGEDVVVADFFGDLDTRRLARWLHLPGNLKAGIERAGLRDAIADVGPLDGIVYGAGFEHDPALLRDLAGLAPLVGNTPETVAAAKDPFGLAALLSRLGLPHPAVAETPSPGIDFLCKRRGGAGGTHIRRAEARTVVTKSCYFQAIATGRPLSALFVANGHGARVVGLSRQWTAPTGAVPFRYGGCAGPAVVPARLARMIAEACTALAVSLGLVGLNSLDMLVEGDEFTILEINPRPGATLDVFDGMTRGIPLWEWHRRAVDGELPRASPTLRVGGRAAAILYAEEAIEMPPAVHWDSWVADVPAPRSAISAGAPICTILAEADDVDAAERLVRTRSATLRRRLSPCGALFHEPTDAYERHAAG